MVDSKAAAADPQDLQKKMEIVQQQFQAEQQVLDKNQDSILNIVSGGARTGAEPTIFDFLRDPGILSAEIGDAAEATAPDDARRGLGRRMPMRGARSGPGDFDDDFFKVYGGAHVLPRWWRSSTRPADSEGRRLSSPRRTPDGLGEGMASSGNPIAGIDLDELLDATERLGRGDGRAEGRGPRLRRDGPSHRVVLGRDDRRSRDARAAACSIPCGSGMAAVSTG